MIRVSTAAAPTAWHTCEIDLGEGPAEFRVRFRLLPKATVALWQTRRLDLLAAIDSADSPRTYDLLRADLDPDQVAEVDRLLHDHVLDWDLLDDSADAPDARLPCNSHTLTPLLADMRFARALFRGLVDASSGSAARKNASPGSAGGSTTSSPA